MSHAGIEVANPDATGAFLVVGSNSDFVQTVTVKLTKYCESHQYREGQFQQHTLHMNG